MKGRLGGRRLAAFFAQPGALASLALQKPCRGRCALPAGLLDLGGAFLGLSPFPLLFFPPPLFPPPSSPLPISQSLFSREGSGPGPCLRSPFEALGGPHRKIFGAACGLVVGQAQLAAICAWIGGKRAGRAPLFCLKWVGGGAGPTKTAGLMNGSSPFFFCPVKPRRPVKDPASLPGGWHAAVCFVKKAACAPVRACGWSGPTGWIRPNGSAVVCERS